MIFYEYPPCSTCQKAKKHLLSLGLTFESINIKTDPPTAEQLKGFIAKSGLPLKSFFNTSGLSYRALNLKERLPKLTLDEALDLLASDGMLIKRPILITEQDVLVGYKKERYDTLKEAS